MIPSPPLPSTPIVGPVDDALVVDCTDAPRRTGLLLSAESPAPSRAPFCEQRSLPVKGDPASDDGNDGNDGGAFICLSSLLSFCARFFASLCGEKKLKNEIPSGISYFCAGVTAVTADNADNAAEESPGILRGLLVGVHEERAAFE